MLAEILAVFGPALPLIWGVLSVGVTESAAIEGVLRLLCCPSVCHRAAVVFLQALVRHQQHSCLGHKHLKFSVGPVWPGRSETGPLTSKQAGCGAAAEPNMVPLPSHHRTSWRSADGSGSAGT